jgi:hypothetical protein
MVKLEKKEGKIYVTTSYNSTFVTKAKNLKGKWNGDCWVFDEKVENLVKEVLKDIYGTDGETYSKNVTVELNLDKFEYSDSQGVKIGDLVIAIRRYRDRDVTVKEGAIIISGGFPSSGGSTKTPRLNACENTVLRVDVPEILYKKIENAQGVKLIQVDLDRDLEAELSKIEEEIEKLENYKKEILKKLGRG